MDEKDLNKIFHKKDLKKYVSVASKDFYFIHLLFFFSKDQ